MGSPRDRGRRPLERLAAVWRAPAGATRTRPILIASVCAGVLAFTLSSALHLRALVTFPITVIAVFLVTTAVLLVRDR
jgi:Flp pilus assembly protein TadB